ncbi:MAG: PAS domain S-box protein [Magnetococcus sp. YQC-5]
MQIIIIESSQREFIKDASGYASVLERTLNAKLNELHLVQGLFTLSEKVESREFDAFVSIILSESSNGSVIQWLPRRSSTETGFKSDGKDPGFAFKILAAPSTGGKVDLDLFEYYSIAYSFPKTFQLYPFATDDSLDQPIEKALWLARDNGSPKVLLHAHDPVEDTPHPYDMDIFMPVYKTKSTNNTLAERRNNFIGFLRSRSDIGLEIEAALLNAFPVTGGIDVFLFGEIAPNQKGRIYHHFSRKRTTHPQLSHMTESALLEHFHFSKQLHFGDQDWRIILTPIDVEAHSDFQKWYPLMILILGCLITLLVTFYMRIFLAKSARVHILAEENAAALQESTNRFLQLQASEQLYRSVTESTQDAILVVGKEGHVLSINTRFIKMWHIPEEILAEKKDETLLGYLLNQVEDPEHFLRRIKELYQSDITDADTIRFKDGRVFERYSAPLTGNTDIVGRVWIFTDITKRTLAERALRNQAEELRLFYDLPFIGMAITSPITKQWTVVNHHLCQMLGYAKEALVELTWTSMTHSDDLDVEMQHFNQIIQGQSDGYVMDKRFNRQDGQLIDTIINVHAIRKADGQVDRLFATVLDITERKQAEGALRENEQQLLRERDFTLDMINALPGMFYLISPDGRFLLWNKKFEEITGYTSDEMGTASPDDFFQGEERDVVTQRVREVFRDGFASVEASITAKDGSRIPYYFVGQRIELDGRHHLIGMGLDISDRKRMENELRQAKEAAIQSQFLGDQALELANAGHWCIDFCEGDEYYISSERTVAIFGDPPRDTFRYHIMNDWYVNIEAVDKHAAEATLANYLAACDGSLPRYDRIHPYRRPSDGRIVWIHVLGHVVRDAQGKATNVYGVVMDITETRLVENAIREAKEAAEAATKAKSLFLANMSHEIRTPMNTIIGMGYLLSQTPLTPAQQSQMRKIQFASENLLGIINDILDFSKIEAGKLELELTPFNLGEVMEKIAAMISMRAEEKGLEMLFDMPADLPHHLIGDALRLEQILINLGSNAVKFTKQGEIVFRIEPVARHAHSIRLKFTVQDSGIGLTEEQIAGLFKPFVQGDSSTTRHYGGTGLGLAICKNLVEMMGGTMTVTSTPEIGSAFSFTILLEQPWQATTEMQHLHDQLGSLRILVVDDNDNARLILQQMVRQLSFESFTVHSGVEAILELERAIQAKERPYDVVLMDWKMPEMNGIETARRIKKNLRLGKPPMIIMMTAFGRQDVIKESSDAGIEGFLLKPVTPSILLNTIQQVFGKEHHLSAGPSVNTHASDAHRLILKGARILVAEDHDINWQVAEGILGKAGVLTERAVNGLEAVKRLTVQQEPFDCVLMDLQMPIMDGYAATRELRKRFSSSELPIVAMTANALKSEKDQCLALGMNDYLTKPVHVKTLFSVLAAILDPSRSDRSDPISVSTNGADPSQDRLMALKGIDVQEALERLDGDRELLTEVLVNFARNYASTGDQLASMLATGDMERFRSMVHGFKGVSANVAANQLSSLAARIEEMAKQLDVDGCLKAVETLKNEMHALKREIELLKS